MLLRYQSAHREIHFINRSGRLHAAVLGTNDGIVSVSRLPIQALALF